MEMPDVLPEAGPKRKAALYVGLGIVGIAVVFMIAKRRSGDTSNGGYPVASSGAGQKMVQPTGDDGSSGIAGLSNAVAQQGQMFQALADSQQGALSALADSLTDAQTNLAMQQAESFRQLAAALHTTDTSPGSTPNGNQHPAATPGGADVENPLRAVYGNVAPSLLADLPRTNVAASVQAPAGGRYLYGHSTGDVLDRATYAMPGGGHVTVRLDQMTPGGPSNN